MANATTAGFAHKKGAIAAARRVLGKDAVLEDEFEAFEIDGGRWDWKAVERTKKQRRTSGKGSPFCKSAPVEDATPAPSPEEVAAAEAAIAAASAPAPVNGNDTDAADEKLPTMDDLPIPGASDEPVNKGANAFGAAAFAALGNMSDRRTDGSGSSKGQRASDKPAAERKPRVPAEVQNGVRKPSVGTTCRHVWDELERLQTENNGTPPDSKQVKALAEQHKWNTNNASIEFYQWRKFNGISGRTKAAAPAAKPVKK